MRAYKIEVTPRRVKKDSSDPCQGCVAKYNSLLCKDIQITETCDHTHIFEISSFNKAQNKGN